jgi:hypothetical protein
MAEKSYQQATDFERLCKGFSEDKTLTASEAKERHGVENFGEAIQKMLDRGYKFTKERKGAEYAYTMVGHSEEGTCFRCSGRFDCPSYKRQEFKPCIFYRE